MCARGAWGLGFQDTEVTSGTLRERIWGQGSGIGSPAQSGLSYIGSLFLHRGIGRCFPGPVPWPCCQHRCAFWWRPSGLCAKLRQWNLSLERNPAGKCAVLGECVPGKAWGGGPCAQLPCGSRHRRCQAVYTACWTPVASVCENQTQIDYKPKRGPCQTPPSSANDLCRKIGRASCRERVSSPV